MATLVNGNGNLAIYAAQDADLIASICGGVTSIAQVGNEFAYDLLDANTIGVNDGVILTKEGRRIQLDIDNIDEFAIPNGQQGTTSYYIIGYKLVTDTESKQTAQTFVQLMDNGTDTIPENTFRGGADEVYVSLYRVTQDGLNIDTVDLLLPKLSNINEINADLSDFQFKVSSGKDQYSPDNGTTWKDLGSSIPDYSDVLKNWTNSNGSYTTTKDGFLTIQYYVGSAYASSTFTVTVDGETIMSVQNSYGSSNNNGTYVFQGYVKKNASIVVSGFITSESRGFVKVYGLS